MNSASKEIMESIKKLLDYLKEYDVETIMNYGSRRPHESLGELIGDVEDFLEDYKRNLEHT